MQRLGRRRKADLADAVYKDQVVAGSLAKRRCAGASVDACSEKLAKKVAAYLIKMQQ